MRDPLARAVLPGVGFSPSQIVCVLCVVGVIVALAAPALLGSTDRARAGSCTSNVKQLGCAMAVYAGDNDGWYPPADDMVGAIMPYVKNNQMLLCPKDETPVEVEYTEGGPTGATPQTVNLSYFLRGGVANDDRSTTILAGDTAARHYGLANAVCVGGNSIKLTPEQLAPYVQAEERMP